MYYLAKPYPKNILTKLRIETPSLDFVKGVFNLQSTGDIGDICEKFYDPLKDKKRSVIPVAEEEFLFPASNPPRYTFFDLFPFSLIGLIANRNQKVKGKKAARIRMRLMKKTVSHNLPLELTLYLVRSITFVISSGWD